jgi:hypothetical protein
MELDFPSDIGIILTENVINGRILSEAFPGKGGGK